MKTTTKLLPFLNIPISIAAASILLSANVNADVQASDGTEKNKISIEWEKIDHAKSYKVYRSSNYDGPYLAKSGKVSDLNWIDDDIKNGRYYWYKVKPIYRFGIPGFSTNKDLGWAEPNQLAEEAGSGMTGVITDMATKLPHWNNVSNAADAYKARTSTDINESFTANYIPSTEEMMHWVEEVSKNDHRRIGSDFGHQAEDYIIRELQNIMSEHCPECEVKVDPFTVNARTVDEYGLRIKQDGKWEEFPSFFANNTGFTVDNQGGTVSGEMVYAGEGTQEDFAALKEKYGDDLSGKVLVIDTPVTVLPLGLLNSILELDKAYQFSDPNNDVSLSTQLPVSAFMMNFGHDYAGEPRNPASIYWRAYDMKAAGVIAVLKDYAGKVNKHWGPYGTQALEEMPVLFVDKFTGEDIIKIADSHKQAEITLKGTVDPNGFARNIYVQLPGQSEETIFVTTHHDAAFKGATEDGTGIALVLAMAKTWAQVPLEQREKTMLFHLSAGHFYGGRGAEYFAEKHKDGLLKKAIININLEHLAARGVKEDEVTHEMVLDGDKPALTLMWISEDLATVAASKDMLTKYNPRLTVAIPGNLLGSIPPGESGHYHKVLGIPYINYLGFPQYLLSADDTLDKVYQERLVPSAVQSADLIESYMQLPENYNLWTDPYKERSLLPF